MTQPPGPPQCEITPPGRTEQCGAPAVATILATCLNGHGGDGAIVRPVCADCLSWFLVLKMFCVECHVKGNHRIPVNFMVGEIA